MEANTAITLPHEKACVVTNSPMIFIGPQAQPR